jgi:peroxiredoxin
MTDSKSLLKILAAAAVVATAGYAATAAAALPEGAKAPDFELKGALAGKPTTFSLKQALHKGPVVLYFFPAAFTSGCTVEAHDFAEVTDQFKQLGATIIGVTAGNVDRVAEFSSVECRNKFEVAADPGAKIAARYDAVMPNNNTLSDRTSFVIAPNGRILMSYTDGNPDAHIQKTLDAVKAYRDSGK